MRIWLLSILALGVSCEDGENILVAPLLSTYPCRGTHDVSIWFEAGHLPKHFNKLYLYLSKTILENSKIRIQFDSMVNITFTVKLGEDYSRISLTDGTTYAFYMFTRQDSMGFLVEGTESGVTPYLYSLTVNDVEQCDDPRTGFLQEFAAKNVLKKMKQCGRRSIGHSELIVNGAPTKPGDWPWHAAIYRQDTTAMKYICGGTLISKTFVLTAAHCVSYRGAKYQPDIFSVILGKYTLYGDNKESDEKQVQEIIIHKDFNYRHLYSDIALIKLKTEAVFSDFIQAACLLRPDDKSKVPTDPMLGTIVGWGFDSTDSLSRTLKQASMPIVPEVTCLRLSPTFYLDAVNENNFCAGYQNGTSACNGDSGSAFQVFVPDNLPDDVKNISGTWHVKGIVSNSLSRFDRPICDPTKLVVFTDVEKFIGWIETYLDQ